jgi:multidrug resistance efflux pump
MRLIKKTMILLVILAIVGVAAFRVTQVIFAKKNDEPKQQAKGQPPLVELGAVTQGLIEDRILRTGDIVPYAQVTIYSKVQGWVEKVNVREGDRVKTGEVLATLDLREAEATVAQSEASLEASIAKLKQVKATSQEAVQSQIRQAKANLDLAQSDLGRARELHQKNFIARQQLDEAVTKHDIAKSAYDLALNSVRQKTWENDITLAEAQVRQAKATLDLTKAQLANLTILSPMDGGVTKRFVDPGTMVKDTTPILTLMDLNQVKMLVNVIEKEFVRLQKGQPVEVTVTGFPGRKFPGRISVITPALELQSRTAEIQITIPNPGYILNPGMFGRAEIVVRSSPQSLLIPIQALVTQEDKDMVFVLKDGKAYRRIVQKGLIKDAWIEIVQGLSLGEPVITAGQSFLKDGMPVRLAAPPKKG